LSPRVQCKIISPFLFSVWADEADASHRVAGRFARPFRRLQDRIIPGRNTRRTRSASHDILDLPGQKLSQGNSHNRDFRRHLRGARASAGNACCVLRGDRERELSFDFNDVIPTVPEVIAISENSPGLVAEISQSNFPLVEQSGIQIRPAVVFDVEIAIAQSADLKFMEMVIPPIECGLNRKMQLMKVPGKRNNESPPNRRRYARDFDPNLCGVQFFERHEEPDFAATLHP